MLSPPYHPPVLALFSPRWVGCMVSMPQAAVGAQPECNRILLSIGWPHSNLPLIRPIILPNVVTYLTALQRCLEFHQTQNKFYKIPLPASTSSHAWWSSFLGPRPDRTHCICHATLMNASCKLSTELRHDDIRS